MMIPEIRFEVFSNQRSFTIKIKINWNFYSQINFEINIEINFRINFTINFWMKWT